MTLPTPAKNARQRATERTTVLGAIINIVLALIKMAAGTIGHSHALFADGIHSLADLVADLMVYLAGKYGNAAADHDHPYGHQRIETVATAFVALFLFVTGGLIIVDAGRHIVMNLTPPPIQWLVLWIALLSLFVNEAIYRYTLKIAKQYESALLTAHAWHRRSDAAASLIVVIGIIGALCGAPILDQYAAILMGLLIIKMAYQMGRRSLEELVDQGLDNTTLEAMTAAIQAVDGVMATHQLRTRSMGGQIFADVHIMVNAFVSVSEGHYIADRVHQTLRHQFAMIKDIIVHVDPEDDEIIPRPTHLPSRTHIVALLEQSCHDLPGFHAIQWLNCHYLDQQIFLSIAIPLSTLTTLSAQALTERYQNQLYRVLANTTLHVFFYSD